MARNYFIDILDFVRIRVGVRLVKNKVVGMVVQLEILLDDWTPVVRYDYAHGIPHRDLMFSDGEKRKEEVEESDLNRALSDKCGCATSSPMLGRALSFAVKDLKLNWEKYLRRHGYEKEIEDI